MGQVEPFLIGDRRIHGNGPPIVSVNPVNGAVNATVSSASTADVELAVSTAQNAFFNSGWKELLPHQRAGRLYEVSRMLQQRAEITARIVMSENEKTYRECLEQIKAAAGIFRYYAAVCETMESEVTPARGDYLTLTVYEPMGVVAAIRKWLRLFEQLSPTYKWTPGGLRTVRAARGAPRSSCYAASFNCGKAAQYFSVGVSRSRLECGRCVVPPQVVGDVRFGHAHAVVGLQVHPFVFDAAPQSLNEYVGHRGTALTDCEPEGQCHL